MILEFPATGVHGDTLKSHVREPFLQAIDRLIGGGVNIPRSM
jgi:hypothetical protein